MTPSHSSRHNKRYRYYTCTQAQKRGWKVCPTKSVPAGEIEKLVLEQVRALGTEPHPAQEADVSSEHPLVDELTRCHLAQPAWSAYEQSRLVHLLIAGVDLDGVRNKITIRFHDHGIEALAQELKDQSEENQA